MKKIYSMLMIAASLTMLWGCSSSDDDDTKSTDQGGSSPTHSVKVGEAPNWTFETNIIPPGDIQGKPDWDEVNFYDYEDNMTAIVFVSEDFDITVMPDDRMAAIVDGEVREVCTPTLYNIPDVEESLYCFMLYIPFGSEDDSVEIQYYNAKANQTYVAKDAFSVKDYTIGDDELFLYTLRPMSAYYLVVPPNQPFTPSLCLRHELPWRKIPCALLQFPDTDHLHDRASLRNPPIHRRSHRHLEIQVSRDG